MDIITSISKQNIDIDKIANDIRNIQKTINSTSQTLGRSDQAAEELIFAAANAPKSDTATVDTYRGLTTLRAKFDMLNETVSKVGAQEKQSRDLEIKIEQEMTRVNTNNFDRVREDLKSVKSENAALVKKLKAMQ
jgi:predicted Co/Zn/Cd cation transporter (cation efflux family)